MEPGQERCVYLLHVLQAAEQMILFTDCVVEFKLVSVRFSPYYRTKEKLPLSSVTYSNTIEPRKCFCRFDLTGTCNDDDCRW